MIVFSFLYLLWLRGLCSFQASSSSDGVHCLLCPSGYKPGAGQTVEEKEYNEWKSGMIAILFVNPPDHDGDHHSPLCIDRTKTVFLMLQISIPSFVLNALV